MLIYSVGWGWTLTPEDMPEGDSLLRIADNVKALGFDGVDYLATRESLDEFFTSDKIAELKAHCDKLGLPIGGVAFQSDTWNNPDPSECATQLHYFEKCAALAAGLGAKLVSAIIPPPFGAKFTRRNASPSEKRGSHLPKDYCWALDWGRFAGMLQQACDIAAKYNVSIALECFPGSLCSTPHAMLQIVKDVDRPNFGIQLDTAHLMNQHIDIETAIFMLGKERIFHVHLKDSDGLTRGNLPAGAGLIDYSAVFAALEAIGYQGKASVEVEFTDNPTRYMRQALTHVKECLDGTY